MRVSFHSSYCLKVAYSFKRTLGRKGKHNASDALIFPNYQHVQAIKLEYKALIPNPWFVNIQNQCLALSTFLVLSKLSESFRRKHLKER